MLGPDPKLQLLDRRQQGSLIRQAWDEQGPAMASGTEAASTSVQHPSLGANRYTRSDRAGAEDFAGGDRALNRNYPPACRVRAEAIHGSQHRNQHLFWARRWSSTRPPTRCQCIEFKISLWYLGWPVEEAPVWRFLSSSCVTASHLQGTLSSSVCDLPPCPALPPPPRV
jgi:hypothetical protein